MKLKMVLLGYTCTNEGKMRRVFEGEGITKDSPDEIILAMYDSLGGEIKKGHDIVKMGSFYDFEEGKPREEKKVKLVFRVGTEVEYVDEGKAVPTEIRVKQKFAKKKLTRKKK